MAEDLARLLSVPDTADQALACQATDPSRQQSVLAGAEAALDDSALAAPEADVVERAVRLYLLNRRLDDQMTASLLSLLAQAWQRKGDTLELTFTELKTACTHPEDFGLAFIKGFLGFYLQDIVMTFKALYETTLLLAYLNRCLGTTTFNPGPELVLDVAAYLDVAKDLQDGNACAPFQAFAAQLDSALQSLANLFDKGGAIPKMLDASLNLVDQVLELLIALARMLPELNEGPLADYQKSVASDPVQLGRMLGIVSAVVMGFVWGADEVLALTMGCKAIKPLLAVGGVVGSSIDMLVGEDDAPSTVDPFGSGFADDPRPQHALAPKVRAAAVSGSTFSALIDAGEALTAEEAGLIRWLLKRFDQVRAEARLAAAEFDAREARHILDQGTNVKELLRSGFRTVDAPSLAASRQLASGQAQLAKLVDRIVPSIRATVQRQRYARASYSRLSTSLRSLNAELERLSYLTRLRETTPLDRLNLDLLTAQLQGALFEAAHIVDARVIANSSRSNWKSVRRFQSNISHWFENGKPMPRRMPAIALLATEHRVAARGTQDVFGVAEGLADAGTVTDRMNSLIVFADEASERLEDGRRAGAFIVQADTSASKVVMAQARVYERFFPAVHEQVRGTLDTCLQLLDETGEVLDWYPK